MFENQKEIKILIFNKTSQKKFKFQFQFFPNYFIEDSYQEFTIVLEKNDQNLTLEQLKLNLTFNREKMNFEKITQNSI